MPKSPKIPIPDRLATVHDYLIYKHPWVQGLKLTPEAEAKLRIGYKPRGVLAGYVVFPLYAEDKHGKPKLVSYMAWHPERGLRFPPLLAERV
jgi:hypothetical protein